MKTLFYCVLILFATHCFATEVTIHIKDVKVTDGDIYISAWDSEAKWIEHTNPVAWTRAKAEVPQTSITVELPEGSYAFSVYHDVDGNQQMSYNAQSLPIEPWGLSNDAPAESAPPSWDDLVVEIIGDAMTIEISLRQL